MESEPHHVKNLWKNTNRFRDRLQESGFNTGRTETPIIPIIVGKSSLAKKMSTRLFEEGIFALPIVFPMVAQDQARIRTIMNAALTDADLTEAITVIRKIGKELGIV